MLRKAVQPAIVEHSSAVRSSVFITLKMKKILVFVLMLILSTSCGTNKIYTGTIIYKPSKFRSITSRQSGNIYLFYETTWIGYDTCGNIVRVITERIY